MFNIFKKIFHFFFPIKADIPSPKKETNHLHKKRYEFHKKMDSLWKNKRITRGKLYELMSSYTKSDFHVGKLVTNDDFERADEALNKVRAWILAVENSDRIKRIMKK